jgi:hypothetical protein
MVCGPYFQAALVATAFLLARGDSQNEAHKSENPLAGLAGEYFFSNGFESENLELSSKGRFKLEYRNCTGGYQISGNAKFVDGHLALTTDLVYRMFFDAAPSDFIPIRWGERLYLVPRWEGAVFCNHINLGSPTGYPASTFYIRSGDEKKKVRGLPDVPKEWKPMLLARPLNGKVVEVMKPRRARVNFGHSSGAWKGMMLRVDCEGSPWAQAVEVHATNCVIEGHHPATVYRIGDLVSSKQSLDD